MKIDLPLQDALAIYLAVYIYKRNGPPEAQEVLTESMDKMRKQIARVNEAQLVEMELFTDACMESDARALQGHTH